MKMLEKFINALIDEGYLEVNSDNEIEVTEDAKIFAIKDLGFDRIDRDKVVNVGFDYDDEAIYFHLGQYSDRMPEDALYNPQVGLR